MKYIIFFIIFMFIIADISAQYISTNGIMQRYWNYRYNLVGDRIDPSYVDWSPGMMIVGAGPGYSIPADASYPAPNSGSYFYWVEYLSNEGGLKWGDTWYAMGRYIEVLASEWKLINDNDDLIGDTHKENLRQTETELFYAMQAVERLDSAGQTLFDNTIYGLRGFLARDDVPYDFCGSHQQQFGGKLWNVSSDASVYDHGLGCDDHAAHATDLSTPDANNKATYGEMSQDQALQAIESLFFILQCIPDGTLLTHIPASVGSYNIRNHSNKWPETIQFHA